MQTVQRSDETQSMAASPTFRMRIVSLDNQMTRPIPGLDPEYSQFGFAKLSSVPVIRVYGATPSGQKTCLHVHRYFPYLYVPLPDTLPDDSKVVDTFLRDLGESIESALELHTVSRSANAKPAPGKSGTWRRRFVYAIQVVNAMPFYGFAPGRRRFAKVQLLDPGHIQRLADLLVAGVILGRVMQPYEAHISYLLHFLADLNLCGMGFLDTSGVSFRRPVPDTANPFHACTPFALKSVTDMAGSGPRHAGDRRGHMVLRSEEDNMNPKHSSVRNDDLYPCERFWTSPSVPLHLMASSQIRRTTTCALEADTSVEHVLNRLAFKTSMAEVIPRAPIMKPAVAREFGFDHAYKAAGANTPSKATGLRADQHSPMALPQVAFASGPGGAALRQEQLAAELDYQQRQQALLSDDRKLVVSLASIWDAERKRKAAAGEVAKAAVVDRVTAAAVDPPADESIPLGQGFVVSPELLFSSDAATDTAPHSNAVLPIDSPAAAAQSPSAPPTVIPAKSSKLTPEVSQARVGRSPSVIELRYMQRLRDIVRSEQQVLARSEGPSERVAPTTTVNVADGPEMNSSVAAMNVSMEPAAALAVPESALVLSQPEAASAGSVDRELAEMLAELQSPMSAPSQRRQRPSQQNLLSSSQHAMGTQQLEDDLLDLLSSSEDSAPSEVELDVAEFAEADGDVKDVELGTERRDQNREPVIGLGEVSVWAQPTSSQSARLSQRRRPRAELILNEDSNDPLAARQEWLDIV